MGPYGTIRRLLAMYLAYTMCKRGIISPMTVGKATVFIMTKPTGEQFHFLESVMGLHYLDTMKHKETNQYCAKCDNDESGHLAMLDTV